MRQQDLFKPINTGYHMYSKTFTLMNIGYHITTKTLNLIQYNMSSSPAEFTKCCNQSYSDHQVTPEKFNNYHILIPRCFI